jgi:MFS family permease
VKSIGSSQELRLEICSKLQAAVFRNRESEDRLAGPRGPFGNCSSSSCNSVHFLPDAGKTTQGSCGWKRSQRPPVRALQFDWRGGGVVRLHGVSFVGAGLGVFLASGLVALLAASLSRESMESWGWRVPFFAGSLIALVALAIRTQVRETPLFEELQSQGKASRSPLSEALRRQPGAILVAFAMAASTRQWNISQPKYASADLLLAITRARGSWVE